MPNNIYMFIGLAVKAGKLISGDETCERAIKSSRVCLVILAEDASENTKKKFINMCKYNDIKLRIFGEKDMLGRYTGKQIRSVLAVTDKNFANKITEMIDNYMKESGGA